MKFSYLSALLRSTIAGLSVLSITTTACALDLIEESTISEILVDSDLATVCDQDVLDGLEPTDEAEANVEFNLWGTPVKPIQTIPITTEPIPPEFAQCMRDNCSDYDRKDMPYIPGINPALPKAKDPNRRDCRDFASDVLQCAYRECLDALQRNTCKVRSLGRFTWKCSRKKGRWDLEGHNQLLLTCGAKNWIIEPQADPDSESFIYDDIQGSIGIYPPEHRPQPPGAQCPPAIGKPWPRKTPWPPHFFFPPESGVR